MAYASVPCWIREIPGHLKTQDMCNDAVHIEPGSLEFVPDHFKTEEPCNEEVHRESYALDYIPDHFKIRRCAMRQRATTQLYVFLFQIVLKLKKYVSRLLW